MEFQENTYREENFLQNETFPNENDQISEQNEILSNFSDSHLLLAKKKKTSLNQHDDSLKVRSLKTELHYQNVASKNEIKNIEILDLNQQESDDVDRPFLFSPQNALKLQNNQYFNSSKLNDLPKEEFLEKKTFHHEKILPNNTTKELVRLSSQKLAKLASKFDYTDLKLRKTFLIYQRNSQKSQFENKIVQEKSINRLSAVSVKKIEHNSEKTIHDKLKAIDIDALSSRLYNSKIRKLLSLKN